MDEAPERLVVDVSDLSERIRREEIRRFLTALHEPGDVVELRSLETHVRGSYCATGSGYYTDLEALARDAVGVSTRSKGVYVTLNRVDPALLARRANEFHWVKRGEPLTSDAEVRRRRSILVDCDPVRLSGIPSTDDEHEAALKKACEIRDALVAEGWPLPIFIDTGNGAALYFRVDLPADDGGLVKRVLEALAARFDCDLVEIDCSVHNPARIGRLPGTLNRKGSNTRDRPHRYARVRDIPEKIEPVPEDLLLALAPGPETYEEARRVGGGFDLPGWIAKHLPQAEGPIDGNGGGQKWVLPICPWDPLHTNRSSFVLKLASGAITAGCLHDSCRQRKWHDLRDAVEPGWRDLKPPKGKEVETVDPPTPWEPFPVETLPQSFRALAEEGSASIGCDVALIALPMLVAGAAAIGNSRRIMLKPGWREPSIQWAAPIAKSGQVKSPALDLALRPTRKIQSEAWADYKEELTKYERQLAEWEEKKKGFRRDRKSAPALDDEDNEKPKKPQLAEYLVADITVESTALVLLGAQRGLLLARDEPRGFPGRVRPVQERPLRCRELDGDAPGRLLEDQPQILRTQGHSCSPCLRQHHGDHPAADTLGGARGGELL